RARAAELAGGTEAEDTGAEAAAAKSGAGFFPKLLRIYDTALVWVLSHRPFMLFVAFSSLVVTGLLYVAVPKGFFPVQDTGLLQGIAEAPQHTSFQAMAGRQQSLANLLLSDPAVKRVAFFVGVDGQNPSIATSRLTVELKDLDERDDRAPVIARRLMERARAEIPGASLYLNPVQDLTIEDRTSRTMYQLTMEAVTRDQLDTWATKLRTAMNGQPELAYVASDLLPTGTMLYVNVNRDAASRLGVTMEDIDSALYSSLGQRLISTIFTQTNQYKVVLEIDDRFRQGPVDIEAVYVQTSGGTAVPITAVASIEERPVQLGISRQGQFPAATLSFNVAEDSHLGNAVSAVHRAIDEIGLPDSVRMVFQGSIRAFESSTDNQLWLILAAIATVYIVLGVLYESYVHPITIISTLPSAGIGALLALILCDMELGVVGIIGLILLIGIVKKNAIMMVDFALDAETRQGKDSVTAIHEACLLRLRPILMTTLCALLSALPLMLGMGMGAEMRRPLGVTMVGGLIFSQMLTLFTTPVVYVWFDQFSRRKGGRNARGKSAAPGGAPRTAGSGTGGENVL
ncbi:MAG: efflux RND transporter permease subunit, partial [Desulfovibrionaceae bacterium]|nr:efflux RND transporter permease subunit [Desulfovibrionaceae bacterium]